VETYLTIPELAAVIKLSEQTIRRYVLHKEIPFHKLKKVVRFRPSEIETWINSGGNTVAVEPEDDGDGKEGELFADLGDPDLGGEVSHD
jgi:excisionase family DNA binding protein